MHEKALQNTAGISNAKIKVETIHGLILLISGERGRQWPATNTSKMIMNRLKANRFDYKYEHIGYQTGHNGIIINRDCWRKIFTFLKAHFASSEG
jgi:hypothetical protein